MLIESIEECLRGPSNKIQHVAKNILIVKNLVTQSGSEGGFRSSAPEFISNMYSQNLHWPVYRASMEMRFRTVLVLRIKCCLDLFGPFYMRASTTT